MVNPAASAALARLPGIEATLTSPDCRAARICCGSLIALTENLASLMLDALNQPGFFTRSACESGMYALRVKGPSPTGWVDNPFLSLLMAAGLTNMPVFPASRLGNWESVWARSSWTDVGLSTVTLLTSRSCEAMRELGVSRPRSMLVLMAAASSAVPSLKVSPERRVKVTLLPPGAKVQPVATAGTALPVGS